MFENINEKFIREIGLISNEQFHKLSNSLIVIFGIGGVGSYAFEALVRVGINNFIIIDKDNFDYTNFNRQLSATELSIGKSKVNIYKERALLINNKANIITIKASVNETNVSAIMDEIKLFNNIQNIFVCDLIDDVNAKIEIIKYCVKNNFNIISSMGTANHLYSKNIKIDKISNTKYCPLAKKIRTLLKSENIHDTYCLYFDEEPKDISSNTSNKTSTISYIPSIAGLKIAEYVINKIV